MAKAQRVSDQLRERITSSGMTRYAICMATDTDQATMSRFMAGKGGMSIRSLDAICELLGLQLVTRTRRKAR